MSDTPRTDSAYGLCVGFTLSGESKKLELELTAMTKERDELLGTVETLEDLVKHLNETILDQEHHIMELERLRRYSPGPHMGQD